MPDPGLRHDRPLVVLAIHDIGGYAHEGLTGGEYGFVDLRRGAKFWTLERAAM